LAARFLYEALIPDLDPLSSEAPLLFMNGPLTGTAGPAVGRFVIAARSPATRLWGESNCGGFWGPELRSAGYDGLWISGRAAEPVYLWIEDNQVEIMPGKQLWGMDTYSTQQAVEEYLRKFTSRSKFVKPRIAVIGPAGESLLPFALILTDHGRVAGRTGMGAVMGSKNLKAIAVQGHNPVPVIDFTAYSALRSDANRTLRADPMSRVLHELGSAGAAEYFDFLGEMPKRYFQSETFPEPLLISGSNVTETILDGVSACHACVIACGRVVKLEDGIKRKGPEYETLVGFGPNLWLNDPVTATRLGELCDRYGMDTISVSNTIGLAFTLFENGQITETDTGGMRLEWGDAAVVERLIHLIAHRQGFGALLAEGARSLGSRFDAEEEAVQVNGLEMPYHDPRGASGMALVYATSPRGACHNQSDYFMVDIGQVEPALGMDFYSRQAGAEKAANVARHQDWRTVCNALVLCNFANVAPESALTLINAACGLEWDVDDMLKCGERAWNLKRAINNRLGLRRSWDKLPKALLRPYPSSDEKTLGFAPELEPMLQAYYVARGWNPNTGIPTHQKLVDLDLGWVADDLMSISETLAL
jgi:aldehyde:ferredoxin oxidoreductase